MLNPTHLFPLTEKQKTPLRELLTCISLMTSNMLTIRKYFDLLYIVLSLKTFLCLSKGSFSYLFDMKYLCDFCI